jgi:hypothetical protein
MKSKALQLLILLAAPIAAEAGSFFGPPPFTNGSPLQSGVQGTYQASAVGTGIAGIIRFSYNSQGNPSALGFNDYVFFVDGTIVSGQTQAAIMDNRISGILNQPNTPTPPPTYGYFDSLGGSFNASIQRNSPFYAFSGPGVLQVFEETGGGVVVPSTMNFQVSGMRTSLQTAE